MENSFKRYNLLFSNPTPLSFKESRSPEDARSLDYLPGASLRGALAQACRGLEGGGGETAGILFEPGLVLGNAYPANLEHVGEIGQLVKPFPASAYSCKRFAGFQENSRRDREERHGVYDLLAHLALFALGGSRHLEILAGALKCPREVGGAGCGVGLVPLRGYYYLDPGRGEYEACAATRQVVTRTGIDRRTGTVREGILYNREMMVEGQSFAGEVVCPAGLGDTLQETLGRVATAGYLRAGNNRTRGMGQLTVSRGLQEMEIDTGEMIRQRCQGFTLQVNRLAQEHRVEQPYGCLVPLTFYADAIFQDEYFRYCTILDGPLWKKYLGDQGEGDLELVYSSSSHKKVIGWNSFLGLPREAVLAVEKGSIFLFGLAAEPGESFWDNLALFQLRGLGEQAGEGYGRFTTADPFHREVQGK